MTRKRRVSSKATAPPVLPPPSSFFAPLVHASPASPAPSSSRASRHAVSVTTTPARSVRSINATAATPTHIKFDPSVLSPPLKKRMHTRSDARAVKIQSFEDNDDEYGEEERLDDGAHRHNIKPDPHLPDPYKRHAKVLQHKGSVYDAMLTRARVHQNQSEFIALQALEYGNQFYLWMRSGTIGLPGKTSLTGPYECHEKIILEFCMVFSSKTCCTWEERHSLRYQEGSYTWIELDYSMGTPYTDVSSSFVDSVSDCDDAASTATSTSHDVRGYKRRRKSSSPASSRYATAMNEWALPSGGSSRTTLASLLGRADSSISKNPNNAPKFQRPASRLHAEVQAFLSLIADPSDYLSYSYSETEEVMEEAQKMPLGRLSKTTIKRGYETLQEIYEALRSRTAPRSQILNLSSHFYSIIPHHSRLEIIDTMVKLGKKVAMMESVCENVRGMSSMEIANLCHQRNYLDECYELLDCTLHPLPEHSDEYALVKTYMKNSSCCGWKDGTLQLANVFRVNKPSEDRRFEPYRAFSNRKILWHGSRLSNWLGILSDGLRIAPPEVASNGRIFGKGVYFTDKASKAQAYCHASARHGGQNKCIFVLSEVALGDVKEMTASDEHAKQWVHVGLGGHAKSSYFHSCKGVGTCRPDESGDVVDRDGAIWPLGKPTQATEATGLSHSEYIIYNPAQARMRYVVLAKSAY